MSAQDPAQLPDGPPPAPEQKPPEPGSSRAPFLVVGVGASAGGLEAFRTLLEQIPPNPGLAMLFAQHLEPTRPSLLPEILSRVTPLAVTQAKDGLPLEADHIYIIPPDADMALIDGHLRLSARSPRKSAHMPIDHLFRSLAEVFKERAIGVILSGGGTDGTLGFQAIKAEGGITFAQDEKTARHDSMPRSAIADGNVDYVLAPVDIARELLRLANHPYPTQPEQAPPTEDGAINDIIALLRSTTLVDFMHYKRSTIVRRIRRRMALRGLDRAEDYLEALRQDAAETQNLYQDFLIRVTRFFRDEEVFDALKETVFPALFKDRTPNAPVRIWVAGCSTGEEPYSLAITLLEYMSERGLNYPIKILATDINEAALDKARAGLYLDNIEMDVSAERLRRFFTRVNNHYQIGKLVRDLCIFSRHNLVSDPPFSRLDLVSCRNVLIYLDTPLQKRVLPILHYALNPNCFLLLGVSETIGTFNDLFAVVDARHRIYSKLAAPSAALGLDFGTYVSAVSESARRLPGAGEVQLPWNALDVQKEADRAVLAKYAPVGVVIDENMTVLQFRGHTGRYLAPAPGLASLDLLKMLHEGLMGETRSVINRARVEGSAVRHEGIPLREGGAIRLINVEVIPIKVPPTGMSCYVVLFEDQPQPPSKSETPGPADPRQTMVEQQVTQLQQELASMREYLQSLIEEHESASEELKSASEELLSANEELQSTNEELQTAKEETQSANEELATLNDELHHRNLELAQVNNDLLNLLAAVNLPIVLVNRDLRIRRFTPLAEKVLNLIPSDVGRPISDIKPNVEIPDFEQKILKVIDTLTPQESEIRDREGHCYYLRIRPYVTLDNKIEGASITLLDIDSIKQNLTQKEERS